MSIRFFSPARVGGTGVPLVKAVPCADSQTFTRGAMVKYDSSGNLVECGTDPAAVLGIALADANTAPGEQAANTPTVVTGETNPVSVALGDNQTIFSGVAAAAITDRSNVGVQYGVTKSGSTWIIDTSDTTNKVVTVVDADVTNNILYFTIIPTVYTG